MTLGPEQLDTRELLKKAYLEIKSLRAQLSEKEDARHQPIAIVGLGCRFPSGANDAQSFWNVLENGVDAVGFVPRDRWDTDALFDPDPDAPGKLYTKHGAFIDGVDLFDAGLFGISPVEASAMDPQQRLLLEVAWEALENANIAADRLRATRTGVFVGLMYQDYLSRQLREVGNSGIGPYLGVGSTFSAAAGRLSYVLGLQGPSIAVDTACSSSLVSVHLACQALRNRECDVALAGGANVMLTPEASINLSKARMLSPSGRCRTFDANADGYIRGEGAGLIVLKRLDDARADGDRILGLIRGSAVNQDGRSSGLTAPNGSAQRTLLREALAAANATADDVEYVECHGTGTPLGDPIEVGALLDVYGERAADNPLAIGSVKTNFGHLESAAGICGLIKSLLILQRRTVPPHLHLTQINPHIKLGDKPVVIPTSPTPWFRRAKRLAAVSAFGFVGTNAHVILEAFDETPVAHSSHDDSHTLTLSAATEPALHALRDRYLAHLQTSRDSLADICFTATHCRAQLQWRLEATAHERNEMLAGLRDARPHRVDGITPRVPTITGNRVALPTYPFQRERYWIKSSQTTHQINGVEVWSVAAQIAAMIDAAPGKEIRDVAFVEGIAAATPHVRVERDATTLRIESRASERDAWSTNTTATLAPLRPRGDGLLSMMFFAAKEEDRDRYRLILEAARFGDANGFRSVWVPERHFTHMGSLYPSPSVLHAALARETSHVRLMAGSVVVPLHHVARIAEEWAMVDNLSGGRVGISCASGWNPDDFVLANDKYDNRFQELYDGIAQLHKLWRGESFEAHAPHARTISLRTYPTPIQRELPLWITAARSVESFQRAGALGANLLTHLLDQDVETLAQKIALYREARAQNGHDPNTGIVTVMVHTFIAEDAETAHRLAKKPFCDYLKSSMPLLAGLAVSRGKTDVDVTKLTGNELDEFVDFLYERFATTRALIGTQETARPLITQLNAAGVNEIACLLDFGPSTNEVIEHLPLLAQLNHFTQKTDNRQPTTDNQLTPIHESGAARSLEAAIQASLSQLPHTSFVPTSLRSLRIHQNLTGPLRVRTRIDVTNVDGSIDGDITLIDSNNAIVAELEGLHVRELAQPQQIDDWFYEPLWREVAWPSLREASRPWLILEDRNGLARSFASRHLGLPHVFIRPGAITEQLGPSQWMVDPEHGFARLLHQLDLDAYEGIAALWPLDEPSQRLGIEAMTALVQALAQLQRAPRLWIVTRDGDLAQSTLHGFAGAVAREHRDLWGGLIELDANADADQLDRALRSNDDEDHIAIRDGRRYARRLIRTTTATHRASFKDDATYLIAGGAGGLGIEVARWMLARGARHILLAGRTPNIALPRFDADVRYIALDIANENEIARVIAQHDIRGVIHAAGIFRDESLLHLDLAQLRDVLRAKVDGALALHNATRDRTLDFFVLFSSFSAILPPHGQAAYAAASSFLDALAHARRREGLPALSINWGAWSEVGFANTAYGAEAHARLEAMGMKRMTPRDGIAALECLFAPNVAPQLAVFPMDVRELKTIDANLEHAPLLRELMHVAQPQQTQITESPLDALRAMDASTQRAYLEEQVALIVGDVLEIPSARLEIATPLTQLGLDSLVAVALKNRVQKDVGVNLPLVHVLRGGSVRSLVDEMLVDLRIATLRSDSVAVEELEL